MAKKPRGALVWEALRKMTAGERAVVEQWKRANPDKNVHEWPGWSAFPEIGPHSGHLNVPWLDRNHRAVSRRLRFQVLHRDDYRCQYCGVGAEEALLRVDHVKPVAQGGQPVAWNLVTACNDCNYGKRDDALINLPRAVPPFVGPFGNACEV